MKISIKRTWRLLTVHIVSNVATFYISSQVLCGFFSKVMLSQWAAFEIWNPHHSCNVRYTVAHCHTQVGLAIVVLWFASVGLSSWLALMRLAVECPPPIEWKIADVTRVILCETRDDETCSVADAWGCCINRPTPLDPAYVSVPFFVVEIFEILTLLFTLPLP